MLIENVNVLILKRAMMCYEILPVTICLVFDRVLERVDVIYFHCNIAEAILTWESEVKCYVVCVTDTYSFLPLGYGTCCR